MPVDNRLKNKPSRNDGSLPRMVYSVKDFPHIASGIWHAQHARGSQPGDTGWPVILTYDAKSQATMSRAAKRYGMTQAGVPGRAFPGTSRDEYPFASTVENEGSTFVTHAPIDEQDRQAAMMNAFYRANGAYDATRAKPFWFEVVVTGMPEPTDG